MTRGTRLIGWVSAFILAFLAVNIVDAWTGPTASPPNANVSAPVNVGNVPQTKAGGFYVNNLLESNTLAVYGNSILGGSNRYLNWGTTVGSGGYGIRDNAGTLEFKNSGGIWAAFAGGGGVPWITSGNNIYNSNSGNVGIGETNPSAKLSFPSLSSTAADGITWYSTSPLEYGIYKTGGSWSGPNYQQLQLNWATGVVIDGGSVYGKSGTVLQPNGGNVGIGTASPQAKLHVAGGGMLLENSQTISAKDADGTIRIAIYPRYSDNILYMDGNAGLRLRVGNGANSALNIDSGGNVGIGTVSPGRKLSVAGDIGLTSSLVSNYSTPTIYLQDTDHRSAMIHTNSNTFYVLGGCGTNDLNWCQANGMWPLSIDLETNNTTVGGQLSAYGGATTYGVYGEAPGNYGVVGKTLSASYGGVLGYTADATKYGILGHANAYSFYGSGTLYNSGSAYATSFLYLSDKRLKNHIKHLKDGLSKILALSPVSFTWRHEAEGGRAGKEDIGFIAQEVEEVLPVAVTTDSVTHLKAVDYPKLVPLLVKAVQEQQAQIETLEVRVRELEDAR